MPHARVGSAAEIKHLEITTKIGLAVDFSVFRTTRGRQNDELRFLCEQETSHRKQKGEVMPQYMVAIYHPDDYDPSVETEETMEEIHALNREMITAGARKFVCGLSPASASKSLLVHRRQKGPTKC
jgi:hypothetical protein